MQDISRLTAFRTIFKLMSGTRIKKGIRFLREYGLRGFVVRMKEKVRYENGYEIWRRDHLLTEEEILRQKEVKFDYTPLISICIPLYNTPIPYLSDLMDCVLNQTYSNWELCLADGSTTDQAGKFISSQYGGESRVRYQRLERNTGIAGNSNEAVRIASGEYIMLADHDDLLELNALYELVSVLNQDKEIDILYTDEDLVDANGRHYSQPRFKPDFNPDFLCCNNYICHIFMVRKAIFDLVGGFRIGYDGAQDHDLILRCCEQTQKIHHIPKVLYHWRAHRNSTAGNPNSKMYAVEAAKKAVADHYQRVGLDAQVEYTGFFVVLKNTLKVKGTPKVSVLIPNKDHTEDLERCIISVIEKTVYTNYEIIIIENNSEEAETFTCYEKLKERYGKDKIKVITWEHEFNFSKINNFGAQFADGEYLLFLNNDTEVISPDWMSEMLGYCQREDVGAVGVKLYYEDDRVQHCGIVIGMGGTVGHVLIGSNSEDNGYFSRLKSVQDISAVTAACMMVRRDVFEDVGGFDENFPVAFNDVDLCLRIREKGKLIVLNAWVELYHYESKTRGYEDTPKKMERFQGETRHFCERWSEILEKGDPYYSVNLSLERVDCSPRQKDEKVAYVSRID